MRGTSIGILELKCNENVGVEIGDSDHHVAIATTTMYS